MRKFSIGCVVAAVTMLTSAALAQTAPGTVYLKNGGRVSGDLMEVLPGERVSVKLANGQTKVIVWSEVARVEDKPAVAAAATAAAPAPDTEGQGEGDAVIVFRSTKPGATLSQVTGQADATAYVSGAGTVTASSTSWKDLCQAPCTYTMKSGYYELLMTGVGPGASGKFTLKPGKNFVLGKPGSSGMAFAGFMLFTLGLASAVVGATFLVYDSVGEERSDGVLGAGIGLLVGGVIATGVGIPLRIVGSSHLQPDPSPNATASALPQPMLLRFKQSF